MSERARRLVFGEVAELYDARRPGYPDELIDDLVTWAAADGDGGPPRALEVGAGTGKATRLLAVRGVSIVAVEPSAEMAAVVRRTTRDTSLVEVIESDFEHAELGGRRFPLVFAAQAWHWVDEATGYARARAALCDGGRLAPFWNLASWRGVALRETLSMAYAAHAPELDRHTAMHPDADDDGAGELDEWRERLARAGAALGDAEVRSYDWSITYTAGDYVELLTTMSAIRLLDDGRRARLLDAVSSAIEAAGGSFRLPMRTVACVATAI